VKTAPAEAPEEDFGVMAAGGEHMLPEAGSTADAGPDAPAAEESHHETEAAAPDTAATSSEAPAPESAADTAIDLPALNASSAAEPMPTAAEAERMDLGDSAASRSDERPHEAGESFPTAPADDTAAVETSDACNMCV
jgi:hypothetical protein